MKNKNCKKKKKEEESEVKYLKCERKENPTKPGFFVEENYSSEVKREITFSDKQILRELIASSPAMKEILEVLQREGK